MDIRRNKNKNENKKPIPQIEELRAELKRERYKNRYMKVLLVFYEDNKMKVLDMANLSIGEEGTRVLKSWGKDVNYLHF